MAAASPAPRANHRARTGWLVAAAVAFLALSAGGAGLAYQAGQAGEDELPPAPAQAPQALQADPEPGAPPTITMACAPQPDANEPGRVQYDHTYGASTDGYSVIVEYGDGKNYSATGSSGSVESAFWHDYPAAGSYGPVSATITDAEGQSATASCGTVYVPVGTDSGSGGGADEDRYPDDGGPYPEDDDSQALSDGGAGDDDTDFSVGYDEGYEAQVESCSWGDGSYVAPPDGRSAPYQDGWDEGVYAAYYDDPACAAVYW